jgi:hypothetical protein
MFVTLVDAADSTSAGECKPQLLGTVLHPLLVLVTACERSTGLPAAGYLDSLLARAGSLHRKELALLTRNWRSKSRYRCVLAALAGGGKSPCMDPVTDALREFLQENIGLAPGRQMRDFHIAPTSTTHASAIMHIKSTGGHVLLPNAEAGDMLRENCAKGSTWNRAQKVDTPGRLLNAANGQPLQHETRETRKHADRLAATSGGTELLHADAAPGTGDATSKLLVTNVTLQLGHQVKQISEFGAQAEARKGKGLTVRFVFTFVKDRPAGPRRFANFVSRVFKPVAKQIFKHYLARLGPRAAFAEDHRNLLEWHMEEEGLDLLYLVEKITRSRSEPPTRDASA